MTRRRSFLVLTLLALTCIAVAERESSAVTNTPSASGVKTVREIDFAPAADVSNNDDVDPAGVGLA